MATVTGEWKQKNSTSATYNIDGKVVATVSGLPNGFSANEYGINGILVKTDGTKGTIQFSASILVGTTKVSIASSNGYEYTAVLDSGTVSQSTVTETTREIATNGTLTIKGDVSAGYQLASDGKSISHVNEAKDKVLATVSKLGADASLVDADATDDKAAVTQNVKIANKVITLDPGALAQSNVTLKSDYGYKLDLGENVQKVSITPNDPSYASGKMTITGTLSEGYALSGDGKTVAYSTAKSNQTLATVSGLGTEPSKSNIGVEFNNDAQSGTITLYKGALKNANVKLDLKNGANYKLALDKDVSGPTKQDEEWTYANKNGTAVYQQVTTQGWTLNGDDLGVTYTAAVTDTYVTVKGLAKIEASDANENDIDDGLEAVKQGMKISGNTITISNPTLLTTTNVTVANGKGHGPYTLKIDSSSDIPSKAEKGNVWALGTTSTYKNVTKAYYSEESNGSIKYNKETGAVTLATVKGLKKEITEDDIKVVKEANDSTVGVIKLSANAFDKKDVSLGAKDNYTFEFDDDGDAAVPIPAFSSSGNWSLTKNTKGVPTSATYKGSLAEGYRLSSDGKTAVYIAAPKNSDTLVTLSGTFSTEATEGDFNVDDETGVVTVNANALGTSNITVKEKGYTLAFSENDTPFTDESPEVLGGMDVWRFSNGTATYKQVIPAYYTINDKGAIVYHKETDVKGKTYLTIKGLNKNLTVNKDNEIDGIELKGDTITLKESALSEANATLTVDKSVDTKYKLALDNLVTAPEPGTDGSWSVSGTTATLKGGVGKGWTQTSDTVITFSKENKNAVLATVKGLDKTGLAEAYDKEAGAITGLAESSSGVITVSNNVLGGTDVTVEGVGGYTLTLADNESEDDAVVSNIENEPSWQINETTATYRDHTSEGFTVADDGKTLKHSDESFGKISYFMLEGLKSGIKIEDIEGDAEAGISIGIEVEGNVTDEKTKEAYRLVTLHEGVLGNKPIKLTTFNGDTKLALGDDISSTDGNVTNGTEDWTIDDSGNAYLRLYTKESYALSKNADSVTYANPSDKIRVATITGLDAKTLKKAYEDGSLYKKLDVELEEEDLYDNKGNSLGVVAATFKNSTITVDDTLLSKNPVKITNEEGKDYDFKIKLTETEEGDGKKRSTVTDGEGWTYSSGVATYKVTTTEGYYIPDAEYYDLDGVATGAGTSIVYNTKGELKTTISGLKDGGVEFETGSDGERTGRIIVPQSSLDSKNVKLTNPKGYDYTLALDNSFGLGDLQWAKAANATKATYQRTIPAGSYTEDGTTLTYYAKEKNVVFATLNGLNPAITAETLNSENNGFIEVEPSVDGSIGTITILSREALGTGNVTIANKDNYKLVLSEDADFSANETAEPEWNYDAKSGKTTLVKGKTAGWEYKLDKNQEPDGKTILYTKPNLTTLATVTGLKPGLVDDYDSAEGTLTGLTFDTTAQKITVDTALLNNKNITLGSKDTYTIALADPEGNATKNIDDDPYWEYKNGKATLIGGTTDGYTQKDGKTISYVKQVKKTLATISGFITDKAFAADALNADMEIGVSADGKSIGVYKLVEDEEGTGKKVRSEDKDDYTPYITLDNKTGVITVLDSAIMGGSTVKLARAKGTEYSLDIGEEFDRVSSTPEPTWNKQEGKTTATYELQIEEGYSLSNDAQSIVYTKAEAKPTVLATLSGLDKNVTNIDDYYIEVKEGENGKPGTITLLKTAIGTDGDEDGRERADYNGDRTGILGKSNVSIAAKDNYTLAMENDKAFAPETDKAYWDLKTSGSAIYKQDTSEGWVPKKNSQGYPDGKTLVYSKAVTTNLATVSGLLKPGRNDETVYYKVKGEDSDDVKNHNPTVQALADSENGDYVDFFTVDGRVVTFKSDATLTEKSKVTIKSGDKNATYTLAVDDAIKPKDYTDPRPYLSGTTVTLKTAKQAGWVVDEKNSTTLSKAAESGSNPVATITGLKKGLKAQDVTDGIKFYGTTISIPQSALGTTNIVLTDNSNSNYTFKDEDWIEKGKDGVAKWTIAKGSATLSQDIGGGYEITNEGKTIKYTEAKKDKNAVVVTVSGLNKDISTGGPNSSSDDIYFDGDKTITVNAGLLTTSKVTAKSSDRNVSYTFALGDDVVKQSNPDDWKDKVEWVTAKGTATYKKYDKAYYSIDAKTGGINYTKESKGTTYMTLSGLSTNVSENNGYTFNTTTKAITIDGRALNKKNIALKISDAEYNDAKLVLDTTSGNAIEDITETIAGGWASGATSKLTGTITAGYSLTNDKTITYLSKAKEKQTITTINNLSKDANIDDSNGVITLSESDLNGKDVTLTVSLDNVKSRSGDDENVNYSLDLASAVSAPEVFVSAEEDQASLNSHWVVKGTKAAVSGSVSAGYILSASHKAVTYTKATANNKVADLVTINGLKTSTTIESGEGINASGRKITFAGGKLDSKVTVTGGAFEVSIDKDFNNASLAGSASADSIAVAGSGITVNTAKGDDYVDLGRAGKNVFFYANGDGNDVIANFTATGENVDKIKLKSGTVSSVETVDPLSGTAKDVLIKIDGTKGSIRLKGVAGSTINILDAKDNQTSYSTTRTTGLASTASGRALLSSDNFITTTPQLSDLVSGSGSDYTVGDLNMNQDSTSLDKQSNVVAYGGKK